MKTIEEKLEQLKEIIEDYAKRYNLTIEEATKEISSTL